MARIVGIDLGTTNSLITYMKDKDTDRDYGRRWAHARPVHCGLYARRTTGR